jgi:hypothetical protein
MTMNSTLELTFSVLHRISFAEVREDSTTGHKSLFSTRRFKPGDILCSFSSGETLSEPTRLTVQTGLSEHITLRPESLQYMNHSCSPNAFFDTESFEVVCLEHVRPGDELTFFYPSTEWDMAEPFRCHCGERGCLGTIQGAAYIDVEVLLDYRLTAFIHHQVSKRRMRRRRSG